MTTKAELINAAAEAADISKAAAERVLNALNEKISESLQAGESVTIPGFGTYSVSERQARTGRNPQTGEEIQIKASKSAKFKAGKQLKDALNK